MEIRLQIPKSILIALNQLYELEQKLKKHGDLNNLLRNVNKMKDAFAEEGLQIDYRMGYERKEGETLQRNGYTLVFSKEDAALAYLASFRGHGAKLWGSLGRAKLFRRDEDYRGIFPLEILENE